MGQKKEGRGLAPEWPTLGLIGACYLIWAGALWLLPTWLAIGVGGMMIALQSSLQHEVIHGHPFKLQWLNEALVWPPLTLAIPFARFRETHLAHHHDAILTDPYDDPETNYLDAAVWDRMPRAVRLILRANNTLAGRLVLGPAVGLVGFAMCEWQQRDRTVVRGWLLHIPAVAAVLAVVVAAPLPVWAYLVAAYIGLALLKLRSFLEHQAHARASGRTVIVEDRGIFALLFLNNNLHVVHHMHPRVPWYMLPRIYRARRDHYLRRNDGYHFTSYAAVMRQYLWRAKDPVAHPLWRR